MGERRTIWSLGIEAPHRARLYEEEQDAEPGDGRFLVDTLFSGLSAGTELSWYKGTNPFLHAAWDPELGAFDPGRPGVTYPLRSLGYMEVGRVTASRAPTVRAGQVVAMVYGHKTGHLADPDAERVTVLPPDLDPILGIYVAHMGPICANGLLHAAAEEAGRDADSLAEGVRGRVVLVTGAGVVGLLTALFARRLGAAEVVVVDRSQDRLAVADALGLTTLPEDEHVWREVKRRWRHGPRDRGADLVFQARGQVASLALALRGLRPQGVVIDLAFYQGGAELLRLGEEFHHNGLAVRCAQISRVPRGMGDRWDRARLSRETVELLRGDGPAIRHHLISDVIPLEAGPKLLEDLAARRRAPLQAVFAMNGTQPPRA